VGNGEGSMTKDKIAKGLIAQIVALSADDPLRGVLFAELIKPFEGRLRQKANQLMNFEEFDSDDVYALTQQKVYVSLGQFRGDSEFATWLFSILIHSASSFRRDEHRDMFEPLDKIPEPTSKGPGKSIAATAQARGELADSRLSSLEFRDALNAAIFNLDPRDAEVFVLCVRRGMSEDEASNELDVSVSTIHRRLEQAKEILRMKLHAFWNRA
jgi:RNA polymerase sigma-70 factor (ECF subfamily)